MGKKLRPVSQRQYAEVWAIDGEGLIAVKQEDGAFEVYLLASSFDGTLMESRVREFATDMKLQILHAKGQ